MQRENIETYIETTGFKNLNENPSVKNYVTIWQR